MPRTKKKLPPPVTVEVSVAVDATPVQKADAIIYDVAATTADPKVVALRHGLKFDEFMHVVMDTPGLPDKYIKAIQTQQVVAYSEILTLVDKLTKIADGTLPVPGGGDNKQAWAQIQAMEKAIKALQWIASRNALFSEKTVTIPMKQMPGTQNVEEEREALVLDASGQLTLDSLYDRVDQRRIQ